MLGKSINRWILAIALLCGFGHTAGLAYAYGQNAQSDSWTYQSVYGSAKPANTTMHVRTTLSSRSSMPVASYGGAMTSGGTAGYGTTGQAVSPAIGKPSYTFKSTSSLVSTLGNPNPSIVRGTTVSRNSPNDFDEEEDPIGVVPDPTPVGDTPWLVMAVLAAGYIALRWLRRRNTAKA